MKLFQNIPPHQKASIIKMFGLLALVILIFTLLSRTVFSGGETLAEYAEANPELALGNSEATGTEAAKPETVGNETTGSQITDNESAGSQAMGNEAADSQPAGNESAGSQTSPPETSAPISPDRITYREDFYYEPLSPDLITAITGISYPAGGTDEISYEDLSYVHILHVDFDGNTSEGELICNNAIAQDFVEIFYELYLAEYRIEKITLIENYDGDDTASMLDNNTSCFNFRPVEGSDRLSKHAYGLAIDINPFYNPYITYTAEGGQTVSPEGSEPYADRTQSFPYKIDTSDLCYRLFTEHGFIWGGNWNSCKDYQHFQKVID